MTSLTNNRFRRSAQRSWHRPEAPLRDMAFLEKETQFYIRLLNQCTSMCREDDVAEYDQLKERFRSFQQAFKERNQLQAQQDHFNPLNQTVSAGGRTFRPSNTEVLQRDYRELKREAFQKIGRFFTVRIR